MIIILTPEADTYVTNLKTEVNDGSLANFGHSATLDLFKLYNENKNSKAWVAFKFDNSNGKTIANTNTLTLTDASGVTKTFQFNTGNNTVDGSVVAGSTNINIGIQGLTFPTDFSARIATGINAVAGFGINAYNNSNNELILKQDKSGDSGDTTFTLPAGNGMIPVGNSSNTKFERIDYSAALLKFDISNFKENYVDGGTFASSVYNTIPGNNQSFKAEIVLKDVSTGISKPKNYSLVAYPLKKDFKEGIGKDTIHFSDSDEANFTKLDKNTNWEVADYISLTSDIHANGNNSYHATSSIVEKGNEDITFDVTNYVKDLIDDNNAGNDSLSITDDKGFVITFSETYLHDQLTYFAKRFGSRHLLNKKFIPQLRIIIKDSDYQIPQNPKSKKRFLNNEEIFYLFNRVNGKLKEFEAPTAGSDTIKFKVGTLFEALSSNVGNFKGKNLPGIKKATISNSDISRFNSSISSTLLSKGFYKDTLTWYWEDSDTSIVEAGSFVVGKKYKIRNYAAGQNDFTLIGSANNNVGTVFTATGAGSGAGDAFEVIEYNILTEDIVFYAGETLKEINYRNLNTAIRVEDSEIIAKDNVQTIEVFFIDNFTQYDAVKVPYDLPSENLGDVYYKLIDIDTNNTLLDYDNIGTKLFFDGEKYIFDLFIPTIFKNKRVMFEFKTKDNITESDKFIKNKKIFRIQ